MTLLTEADKTEGMNLKKALGTLGFRTSIGLTEESIKKNWKDRMKKVHPDLAGRDTGLADKLQVLAKDTNEAYDFLKMFLEAMQAGLVDSKSEMCIIDIYSLQRLYKGGQFISHMEIDGQLREVMIDKSNIRTHRVIIQIPFTIKLGLEITRVVKWCSWNIKDEYSVNVEVDDENISEQRLIEVTLGDKTIRYNMLNKSVRLTFGLQSGIKVTLKLERVSTVNG